jgi:hypothetical protein
VPAGGKKKRDATRYMRVDLGIQRLQVYLEQRPKQHGHGDEIKKEPRRRCEVFRGESRQRAEFPRFCQLTQQADSRAFRTTVAARSGKRRASATASRISSILSLSIPQCSRVIAALVKRSSIVAPVGTSVLNSVMRERTSRFIVTFAAISALAFVLMIPWEVSRRNPMIDLRMVATRQFGACFMVMLATGAILLATTQFLPQLVQQDFGYTATWAGLVLSPGGLVTLVMMFVVGRLAAKVQPKYLIVVGALLIAVSMYAIVAVFRIAWSISSVVMRTTILLVTKPLPLATIDRAAAETLSGTSKIK